ncbi:hypothetical protein E5288_WYG001155 [Bos mutus]|uniref:Uncharacterized protein n=1 Tax=Bos mutus TaxID=72004 RepID=A0A6B0S4R8_9CETA|nr:hypothetical protein [Bos mutus]
MTEPMACSLDPHSLCGPRGECLRLVCSVCIRVDTVPSWDGPCRGKISSLLPHQRTISLHTSLGNSSDRSSCSHADALEPLTNQGRKKMPRKAEGSRAGERLGAEDYSMSSGHPPTGQTVQNLGLPEVPTLPNMMPCPQSAGRKLRYTNTRDDRGHYDRDRQLLFKELGKSTASKSEMSFMIHLEIAMALGEGAVNLHVANLNESERSRKDSTNYLAAWSGIEVGFAPSVPMPPDPGQHRSQQQDDRDGHCHCSEQETSCLFHEMVCSHTGKHYGTHEFLKEHQFDLEVYFTICGYSLSTLVKKFNTRTDFTRLECEKL